MIGEGDQEGIKKSSERIAAFFDASYLLFTISGFIS